jgi:hypothetical protein
MQIIRKHKGLGDTVEAVAKAIYADKIAEAIAQGVGAEDCGCAARKEKLNDPELWINKIMYGSKQDK